MTEPIIAVRRTPLHQAHTALGAVMVTFSGWEMPQQYSSIREEVEAVRRHAGVFDVSHMGEFTVSGPGALEFVQRVTTNDASRLAPGQAQYSLLCREDGGIVDDLLVYRLEDEYQLVVNAGRLGADWDWLRGLDPARDGAALEDRSEETALIALQGPQAAALLPRLTGAQLARLARNDTLRGEVAGVLCLISRTGYTGEDGFELFCPAVQASKLWEALLSLSDEVRPCGLGARDVLRLESGLRLYGQDMDESTNPYAASLAWVVKPAKGPFTGRDVLAQLRESERRRTVGLLPEGRGSIARHGSDVHIDGRVVCQVTSGTFSFTLGRPVATCIMEPPGEGALTVEVRGREVAAAACPLPFYKPQSKS